MSWRSLVVVALIGAGVASAKDRTTEARERRGADIEALLKAVGLKGPVDEVYLRGFKQERVLELWAGKKGAGLTLVKSYPFCAASGELGPKRVEGDLQVPEGFYEVSEFNPTSSYHFALKVSYPNPSDRLRTTDSKHPGGLIYLHGECASIGCIAIQNEPIEEVYLIALDSKVRPIHFDLFPSRLAATPDAGADPTSPHLSFWNELAPGLAQFEQTHRPPRVKIDQKTGAYSVLPGTP